MKMNDSQCRTMTVPGTPTQNPSAIAIAMTDRPMRVLVTNVGPTELRVAFSSSSLGTATADGVDHFQMNANSQPLYFVLAPKQRLYAVSVGATGRASIHTSDALPWDVEELPS